MDTLVEKSVRKGNGYTAFLFLLVLIGLNGFLFRTMIVMDSPEYLWVEIPLFILMILVIPGFFVVQPNEARVLVLFGNYIGSVRESGFCWANPFAVKRHVSLRIRNFNSDKIKVNDSHGNPIEITLR